MSLKAIIENKLRSGLDPRHLEVVNESDQHNVPPGSESHFKVTVVSDRFEGKNLVARHREIYRLLADELKTGVHALALHTLTPPEWDKTKGSTDSPPCLGGSKH